MPYLLLFSPAALHLGQDEGTAKAAATLLRECCRQTMELAQAVVGVGGILVET